MPEAAIAAIAYAIGAESGRRRRVRRVVKGQARACIARSPNRAAIAATASACVRRLTKRQSAASGRTCHYIAERD